MRELHVIALSEDGRSVVLATSGDAAKGGYRVLLDGPLTAAVRGELRRPGEDPTVESDLTPKDIQSRLRAGETPQQIADSAGVPVARVERFEGPVISERARVVEQTRAAFLVRGRKGRSALPLGDVVDQHLAETPSLREESVDWSARRREDGEWLVELTWVSRARTRTAAWTYDPATRSVAAVDGSSAAMAHTASPTAPRAKPVAAAPRTTPLPRARRRAAAPTATPSRRTPAAAPAAAAPTRKPAAKKAAPAKPVIKKAVPAKPVAKKAAPAKPVARPVAKKAAPAKPVAKAAPAKPVVKKAAPAKPVARPVAKKAAPAKPVAKAVRAVKAAPAQPAAKKAIAPKQPPAAPKRVLRIVTEDDDLPPIATMDPAVTPREAAEPRAVPRRAAGGRASVPAWADVLLGTSPSAPPAGPPAAGPRDDD